MSIKSLSDNEESNFDEKKLFTAANHFVITQNYKKAQEILLELISAYPCKRKYYEILGFVCEKIGQIPLSLKMRVAATRLGQSTLPEWELLLSDCIKHNEITLAESCSRRVVSFDPKNQVNLQKHMEILLHSGKKGKLVECYKNILNTSKNENALKAGLELCLNPSSAKNEVKKIISLQNELLEDDKQDVLISLQENERDEFIPEREIDFLFGDYNNGDKEEGNYDEDMTEISSLEGISDFEEKQLDIFDMEGFLKNESSKGNNLEDEQAKVVKRKKRGRKKGKNVSEEKKKKSYGVSLLEKYFGVGNQGGLRTLDMDVEELKFMTLLFNFYIDLGHYSKVEDFFNAISAQDKVYLPQEIWVCHSVALIHTTPNATKIINEAIENCSLNQNKNEDFFYQIGTAFLQREKIFELISFLDGLKELKVYDGPKFWYLYGYASFMIGDNKTAEKYLNKIVSEKKFKNSTEEINARLFLSKIYTSQGKRLDALEILTLPGEENNLFSSFSKGKVNSGVFNSKSKMKRKLEGPKGSFLKFSQEKNSALLAATLELIVQQVREIAENGFKEKLVLRSQEAMKKILFFKNSVISAKTIFSFPGFPVAAVILAKLWARPKNKSMCSESLKNLSELAAIALSFSLNADLKTKKNLAIICFLGSKECLNAKEYSRCYKILRPLCIVFPGNKEYISLAMDLVIKSKNENYITRKVARLAKVSKESISANILVAFLELCGWRYLKAAAIFLKVFKRNPEMHSTLLYAACSYSLHHKKKSCKNKTYSAHVTLSLANSYKRRMGKSAQARYNSAELLLHLGLKGEAFTEFERVLFAEDKENNEEFAIKYFPVRGMRLYMEYKPGEAYRMAEERLEELCSRENE